MKKPKGKNWAKPQLTILGRGTSEENVLANCKGTAQCGAQTGFAGCMKYSYGKCHSKCATTGPS